ncbi:uncharacterized protein TNCV_1650961 [Trichonephila clavipes]|nr:uncharacterized protein TNCV_1650961 [Trichonephila clavipes]
MSTLPRLLMVTWNANGLRSRMWELRDFVNKYQPDIISVQETWLRPSHTIALANYKIHHANTPEDIDEQIAAFTDRLHHAYTKAFKPLKQNDTFYINRDLNQHFKERNRAKKTWHYTRSPADKNTLNKLQKQIKRIVTKYEQRQWDESLACLEAEDGSLWKAARDFRKKAPPIPALKGPAKIAHSDADKSEIIADSLQDQFKLNSISNDIDRAITHVVHTYLNNENNFTNIPPFHPYYQAKLSIISIKLSGRGSRVVLVSERGLLCHGFEPSTTKDPPCRAAMHVKSVES